MQNIVVSKIAFKMKNIFKVKFGIFNKRRGR